MNKEYVDCIIQINQVIDLIYEDDNQSPFSYTLMKQLRQMIYQDWNGEDNVI